MKKLEDLEHQPESEDRQIQVKKQVQIPSSLELIFEWVIERAFEREAKANRIIWGPRAILSTYGLTQSEKQNEEGF